MNQLQRVLGVVLLVLLCGCDSKSPPPTAKTIPTTAVTYTDFQAMLTHRGSATFRSYQGALQGHDTDLELIFLPKDALTIIQYGLGVRRYSGTYTLDSSGALALRLPKGLRWFPTHLTMRSDGTKTLLFVAGDEAKYHTIPGGMYIWPFALIPAKEEAGTAEKTKHDHAN